MKLRIYKFLIAGICITCLSCNGLLDREPLGRLDADVFFKTASDAVQAVNVAYQPLLINNENNNFYWVFGTVASDEALSGGDGSRAGIIDIDVFSHTPATEELNQFWKLNYKGIVQANVVIEKTPFIEADEELKNRIIGEALFLRSWYHFVLSQVFGDIPLITEVLDPDEVRIAKTHKPIVLEQIAADAIQAASFLPVSYAGGDVGRATKGAALALAAKAYLYLEQYQNVVSTISDIKALGIYALQADYRNNFIDSTQNNSESVWEIQHANLELGVGNNLNQWWFTKKLPDGYGFAEVSMEFINAFEPNDPRLKFTVARHNEPYF